MKILITGGAGFIGSNLAVASLRCGDEVCIFDNLSRAGALANLLWIQSQGQIHFSKGDVADFAAVSCLFKESQPEAVVHLAAQVAVTSSIADPRHDLEVNLLGTFNILEALRQLPSPPLLLFASTNKVYGSLSHLAATATLSRYQSALAEKGIDESQPLDFHSPYGCSKGAADQYVRDYARIYQLPTVVLRQSCIYGPRQFGIEEQGWLAWFGLAALTGRPLTIYGNGLQVRDILEISDLVRFYRSCLDNPEAARGQIFNIGGGPTLTISLRESLALLQDLTGHHLALQYLDARQGDQKLYISNLTKAKERLGWCPQITKRQGINKLLAWLENNLPLIKKHLPAEILPPCPPPLYLAEFAGTPSEPELLPQNAVE